MRRLLYAVLAFGGGTVFGLVLAAIVVLGLALMPSSSPLTKRAQSGTPDVSVTVSESHIQTLIDREMKGASGYRNVKIKIDPGNLVSVSGDAGVMGLWFPIQVNGNLTSDGEVIRVNVAEMKVGSLPIKLDLAGLINDPMTRAMRSMMSMGPYRISGISTQQGSITVSLTFK